MRRRTRVWLVGLAFAAAGCDAAAPPPRPADAPDRPPVFDLTPRAVAAALEQKLVLGLQDPWYVRLTVSRPPGGKGLEQTLTFDPAQPGPEDYPFPAAGLRGVVAKSRVDLLRGTVIDYSDDPESPGFVIHNPNPPGEPAAQEPAPPEAEPGG